MIFALDPGKNGCGLAWGHAGRLVGAKYVENENKRQDPFLNALGMGNDVGKAIAEAEGYAMCTRLIIEHPRIYYGKGKNDANDLFALVAVGGVVSQIITYKNAIGDVRAVYPSEWKGQVPKEIMTKRIISKLDSAELKAVQLHSKTFDHNTFDAVGILLWDFGRL